MKNNYPIRYCVLPLSEKGRLVTEEEYMTDTICYIAIKCYVVGEEKEYTREGITEKKYKVVPTFAPLDVTWFREIEPRYEKDECMNCIYAKKIFKDLEPAEKCRDVKNKELIESRGMVIPDWANIREKFANTLKAYKDLEEKIEKNTSHLNTKEDKFKEQNIYSVSKEYGVIDEAMSIYFMLEEEAVVNSFEVYTVTEEEYKKIKEMERFYKKYVDITPKDLKSYMHTPLMYHRCGDDFVKLVPPEGSKERSMYVYTKEPGRSYDRKQSYKEENPFCEYFFTMETYNDVVESYNLEEKRNKSLTLNMDYENIWTNDRYKY